MQAIPDVSSLFPTTPIIIAIDTMTSDKGFQLHQLWFNSPGCMYVFIAGDTIIEAKVSSSGLIHQGVCMHLLKL